MSDGEWREVQSFGNFYMVYDEENSAWIEMYETEETTPAEPVRWQDFSDDDDYFDSDEECEHEYSEENPNGVPDNAINWTKAEQYIGKKVTIFGMVMNIRHNKRKEWEAKYYPELGIAAPPTFITMGASYPNKRRVQIVIWDQNRRKFSPTPEALYSDKAICVTGRLYLYKDVISIEVSDPSQVQIMDLRFEDDEIPF
jgi:hypothetical protein